MVINEKKKDNKIDVIFIIAKLKLPEVIIFLSLSSDSILAGKI